MGFFIRKAGREYDKCKKTKAIYSTGSGVALTKEDMEKRKRKIKRLEQINENYSRITEDEFENPYRIQALALIAKDEDIPEELLKQIKEFEANVTLHNQKVGEES